MGAWDTSIFGNDTACDWTYELETTDDLTLIEKTLDKVIEQGEEYLEAPDAEEALAAVEAITRLKGNGGEKNSYTEALDQWVSTHPLEVSAALVEKGNAAIEKILSEQSELMENWAETGDFETWKASVADVYKRLNK